ncbi:MAG TPA: prepilin-type N-terminal cleavage/methylation domain-containing protein [Polyangiaceae bacterium]|jgi:general secretion pathway protein G|nr:prepilin-type N-terminal cleavage/methylation domain-containing protein [Polyangiaceae bacterium]
MKQRAGDLMSIDETGMDKPGTELVESRAAELRVNLVRALAKARRARGVTLVEVLIVVAIMAMLAGGVAFALIPQFQKASVKTAKENAIKLRQVVALWRTDTPGECPTIGRLKTDKLLDKVGGDDPWGKPYTIRCSDGEIYVESKGPDQKQGTDDDIVVPSEKDSQNDEDK